tara:strand:- start:1225 stop:2586 length:1362 start_codon:yes stop_codon:yes gene_type:complete
MVKRITFLLLYFTFLNFYSSQDLILGDYVPGNGIVLASTDNNYKVVLRGYSQSLFESRTISYDSSTIVDNNRYNRFRARRIRLRLSGNQLYPGFSYRLQLNLAESEADDGFLSNILWDAWLGYNINKTNKIIIGQKGTPTDNIEVQMASNTLQLPERSRLTGAFSSIREIGVFYDNRFKVGNKAVIKSMFNITTGDGYAYNFNSRDYGGLKYGCRINILPFGLFRNFGQFRQVDMVRELNPKLLIGFSGSFNNGMSSRRGRRNGDFLFYNIAGVDTSYRLPNYLKVGGDLLFKYRGFSLLAEYVNTKAFVANDITHRNDRYGNDPSQITSSFGAFNEDEFLTVSSDEYVKRQLILGSGFNIQAGYLFKSLFSIDGRFTKLNPNEFSFMNNATYYNRQHYYEIGLSKYFSKNYSFKVQASYRFIDDAKLRAQNYDRLEFEASENIFYFMVQVAF